MKKGFLYAAIPVAALILFGLAWWLRGAVAAGLYALAFAGGWVGHKHRSYIRSTAGLGKLYLTERIAAWRKA